MNREEVAMWQNRYEAILNAAKQRFKPLIVLWGPGTADEKGFAKRCKIRESILKENPNASVVFPEDPQLSSMTQEFVGNADIQEILQGLAADLVIALDISHGVAEEVARYSRIPDIANRLVVIASHSRKEGYSGVVRRTLLNIEFLSEEDLQTCDHASRYCREQMLAWLIRKTAQ